jgi:hypothetical protein
VGLAHPLIKMNTRGVSWSIKAAGA